MPEMKHTPGPFHVEDRFGCWAIVDEKGQDIAYQDKEPRFFEGEPCGSVTSRGRTAEELKANANLFAASPDLLEACVRAERWYANHCAALNANPEESITIQLLRAAIAKATP